MAWQPWWDRMAEMHSAQEREEFMKGVAGFPGPRPGKIAGLALSGLLIGWGLSGLGKDKK
jgi:hypothetical protein